MNIIEQWEQATDNLRDAFIDKYFSGVVVDSYWVGDVVGEITFINDHFFSVEDMVNYLRYDYSAQEMFQREDEREDDPHGMNIKTWKKLKAE